ncbi:MAG TPA: c-type cytochrome [Chitinophagaceae bacterium]|nr:c-type cytochrome [Chitinophagaceae bacterium]
MKQFIIFSFVTTLAWSCGNNAEQTSSAQPVQKEAQEAKPAEVSAPDPLKNNPDYSKGLELVAQSDCFTCHKVDDMNAGPAYREIANKYEANAKNISLLAGKIINGGSGVWGQVPMTPHANLSKKEAEQMVKYIMLLKSRS